LIVARFIAETGSNEIVARNQLARVRNGYVDDKRFFHYENLKHFI
jgi:hypothetical protein